MEIIVENLRGFEGRHKISLRPITILLGENSSGKTTLLAAIHAALNNDFPFVDNLFNRSPFELGSFDTIATYRGGKYGRASNFSLGWSGVEVDSKTRSICAKFISHDGAPKLDCLDIIGPEGTLNIKAVEDELLVEIKVAAVTSTSRKKQSNIDELKPIKFSAKLGRYKSFRLTELYRYYLDSTVHNKSFASKDVQSSFERVFDVLHSLTFSTTSGRPHATALAPLRTRPRRTYDELNEEFKPEGDHIPMVLTRLLSDKSGKFDAELEALLKYGNSSGLFKKIDVKRLGKQLSDPFQVRIKTNGPDANLIDVGYGVSQSLPIVLDSIMAPINEVLLVQQPEVHLHPKAQAALGSFFAESVAKTSKQYIVETHSDYLLDRVRIEVAAGKLPAKMVQLLYLERSGLDIKVHHINLDDNGNVLNAPPSYREFFLAEELKLMNRVS